MTKLVIGKTCEFAPNGEGIVMIDVKDNDADAQVERCRESAKDMLDSSGCSECAAAADVIEQLGAYIVTARISFNQQYDELEKQRNEVFGVLETLLSASAHQASDNANWCAAVKLAHKTYAKYVGKHARDLGRTSHQEEA